MIVVIIAVSIGCSAAMLFQYYKARKARFKSDAFGCPKAFKLIANRHSIKTIQKSFNIVRNPSERYFNCVVISRSTSVKQLTSWVAQAPKDPQANLCYGVCLIQHAWQQVGLDQDSFLDGDDTGFIQDSLFRHNILKAKSHLRVAAQQSPSDPTPFIFLLVCATYLQEGVDKYFTLYSQATSLDPNSWGANVAMVVALSKRWGGDNQHMLAFAKNVAEKAQNGSDVKLLPYKAYLELWKYTRHQSNQLASNALLNDPDVRHYCQVLFKQWQPNKVRRYSSVFACYNALAWLWVLQEHGAAKQVFSQTQHRISERHLRWTGLAGKLAQITAALT